MLVFGLLSTGVLSAGVAAPTVVAIIAGIIIPFLGFLVTVVWRFHKRLLELEKESQTREKVVYGGENNPLNLGLVKEIKTLKEDFNEYQHRQEELLEEKERLFEKLKEIEDKVEEEEEEQEG
jgi:cell division protein FtsN